MQGILPIAREHSVLPKRAKKKRCNSVKAATPLSIIFSCVRTSYLSSCSTSATSFAVAVTILNPLSLIPSRRVSSCCRCVDFSASLFGKKGRYIVTSNKFIKDLQTWLSPLIFNIGKVTWRNIVYNFFKIRLYNSHYRLK